MFSKCYKIGTNQTQKIDERPICKTKKKYVVLLKATVNTL